LEINQGYRWANLLFESLTVSQVTADEHGDWEF